MKKVLLTILILMMSFFKAYSQKYEVVSIDSTSNNYIVLVKKTDKKYLIISPKIKKKKCLKSTSEKIKVGFEYDFLLEESTIFGKTEPNVKNSIFIDDKKIWTSEDDYDIFFCENLKGLYYLKQD